MLLHAANLKCRHTGAAAVKSSAERKLRTLNTSSEGKTCKEPCKLPGSNASLAAGSCVTLCLAVPALQSFCLLAAGASARYPSAPTYTQTILDQVYNSSGPRSTEIVKVSDCEYWTISSVVAIIYCSVPQGKLGLCLPLTKLPAAHRQRHSPLPPLLQPLLRAACQLNYPCLSAPEPYIVLPEHRDPRTGDLCPAHCKANSQLQSIAQGTKSWQDTRPRIAIPNSKYLTSANVHFKRGSSVAAVHWGKRGHRPRQTLWQLCWPACRIGWLLSMQHRRRMMSLQVRPLQMLHFLRVPHLSRPPGHASKGL